LCRESNKPSDCFPATLKVQNRERKIVNATASEGCNPICGELLKTFLCACLISSEAESTKRFSLKQMLSPDYHILNQFLLRIHTAAAKSSIVMISKRSDSSNKENMSLLSLVMVMVLDKKMKIIM